MSQDMSQYLGVFLDESFEQLSLLERECVELESAPEPGELLQELFRAAHTIKGASRAMGFEQIGELTHEMENVLDDLRNERLALSRVVVDALLAGTDSLGSLLEAVRQTSAEPVDVASQVEPVKARLCSAREGETFETTQAQDSPGAAAVKGSPIWIELSPDCMMKGCRAVLAVQSMREWIDVLATVPDAKGLEAEEFGSGFQVLVPVGSPCEELLAMIAALPDVISATSSECAEAMVESEPPVPVVARATEPEPEPEKPKAAKASTAAPAAQTVRVDVTRLDSLLNLVGELVIDRTQLTTQLDRAKAGGDLTEGSGPLDEVLGRIERVTYELQDEVMKSRMLPIDGVFQRMPRMVRDLAQKLGKEVSFTIEGGETELDRSVLDMISDPLIHILRNSLDHGIEDRDVRFAAGKNPAGSVHLSARRDRNQILIEITDDGKGIDPVRLREVAVKKGLLTKQAADVLSDREAVNLIFAAGFSTASTISDISGRGVGMDIVRSNLERIGGKATVESEVGVGSKVTICLPLTLAIVRAVLVSSAGSIYAIPISTVSEMIDLSRDTEAMSRCTMAGQAAILLRGETLALFNLSDALEADPRAADPERNHGKANAVIVHYESGQVAFSVDALHGDQEVVIKPIGGMLGEIPGVAGASILGDGRVALIIDPARALQGLFARSMVAA